MFFPDIVAVFEVVWSPPWSHAVETLCSHPRSHEGSAIGDVSSWVLWVRWIVAPCSWRTKNISWPTFVHWWDSSLSSVFSLSRSLCEVFDEPRPICSCRTTWFPDGIRCACTLNAVVEASILAEMVILSKSCQRGCWWQCVTHHYISWCSGGEWWLLF
jgi:hypothetical protein